MKRIDTFYRLTKPEKDRLIEACRKEIEERRIKETETVRQILETLLEEKWEKKKKNAQTEMRNLQQQVTDARNGEQKSLTAAEEQKKKLTAAEKKNSELNGELRNTVGQLRNCQDRLKASEEKVSSLTKQLTDEENKVKDLQKKLTDEERKNADLQKKLTESEENAAVLQRQLKAAEDSNDTLRRLYTASENTAGKLRKTQSENEAQIRKLEADLETKTNEAETSAAEAKKHQKETETLEKYMEKEGKEHEAQKRSSWRNGWFFGVLVAAALSVIIFPTRHLTDAEVPAEQNFGVSGTYTGGSNMFERFSGFGELSQEDSTVCTGFWVNGMALYAAEYIFPDGGVFSGSISPSIRPLGAGTYTRPDGEKVFGIWSWAQEKTVEIGESDVEYTYTGALRFGKPYGYGIFEGIAEEETFVGEFYDDAFRNGTWFDPDGTPRKVNSQ